MTIRRRLWYDLIGKIENTEDVMIIQYESHAVPTDSKSRRPLPPWARIVVLVLIWTGAWFVSVLCFHLNMGRAPKGDELLWLPLTCFWFAWPVSFGLILGLPWVPGDLPLIVWVISAIAFWPCYITFLVLALRTGKIRYFALLAAMNALSSYGWHLLCAVWIYQ